MSNPLKDTNEIDMNVIGSIIKETKTLKEHMGKEALDPNDILKSIHIEENIDSDPVFETESYEWKKDINLQKIKERLNQKEGMKAVVYDPLIEAANEASKKEEILDQQKMIEILKEEPKPQTSAYAFPHYKDKEKPVVSKPILINPVDFVNYIEINYPKIKINTQKESQMKRKERPKYDEIQSEPLHKLTDLIVSKSIQVHCLKTKGDLFLVGDTTGTIFVYSLSKKKEERMLSDKDCKSGRVNTMEITVDDEYLIAGYSNGLIALWDMKSFKCKKVFDKVHTSSIIATKVCNKDKTSFELFSSDCEGNVMKSIVKDRLVTYSITSVSFIMQNKNPVYIVDVFDFPSKEKFEHPYLCCFSETAIICCLSQIKIIMLEPEIAEVFSFERPEDLQEYEVADFGYGLGYAPFTSSSVNSKESNSTLLLLAISWGKTIYLFNVEVNEGKMRKVTQIGYYINNKTVLRLGFISHSILILFDSGKYFRAVSTRDFSPGQRVIDAGDNIDKSGRLIDPETKQQKLFQDKNQQWKTTYINCILISENSVYLMGKKTVYNLKLLKWEKCIDNISQDSAKLLLVCSDIYHGRQGALADIPQNEQLRKKAIQTYFEKNIVIRSDLPQAEIEQYMSNIIELCIEIEMFDHLLNKVQNAFENHKDLFLRKLEPFILCDKMLDVSLSQTSVERIIELYASTNQLHSLEQLLIHLNIDSVSHDDIKARCSEKHLINPFIYICMNKEPKMMFEPIKSIYAIFLRKSSSLNFALTSYEELLKDKRLIEIKTSKEYMGYKLFWYIGRCLKGLVFPSETQMKQEEYEKIVLEIVLWLLVEKNFNELIKFDKACLFGLFKAIFSNQACLQIISKANNNNKDRVNIYAPLHSIKRPVSDIDPSNLLLLIKYRTIDSVKTVQSLQCLYEFIGKAASYVSIDNDLVKESISHLLQSDEQKSKSEAEVIEISNDLIQMLEKYSLKSSEFYGLIVQSEKSVYVLVKLKLYEKDGNFKRCLDLLLDESNSIPDRSRLFFKWIEATLQCLSEGDKTTFSIFKNDVLNSLFKIGALSMTSMCEMINKWFTQDSHLVLNKLNASPEVKLKYVEYIIANNIKDKDTELYQCDIDMLNLHIELLCQLGQSERILPIVKDNSVYPLNDCLEITLKHNVIDASIFLYQATGAPSRALALSMVPLEAAYKDILSNLSAGAFNLSLHEELKDKFIRNKSSCIEICERNGFLHDELWFEFLDKMYLYYQLPKVKISDANQPILNEFRALVSVIIKSTLGMMCNYVSIVNIIDKVTTNSHAEFKEMKESLVQIIANYTHQLNILGSAKSLLSSCVLKKKEDLVKLNVKGYEYDLDKCDICELALFDKKPDTEAITFFCGHKMHVYCNRANANNAANLCSVCTNTEIDVSNRTIEFKKPIIPQPSADKKPLNLFKKKMDVFDKQTHERLQMVIEESMKI